MMMMMRSLESQTVVIGHISCDKIVSFDVHDKMTILTMSAL